jgi:hypothetical protein
MAGTNRDAKKRKAFSRKGEGAMNTGNVAPKMIASLLAVAVLCTFLMDEGWLIGILVLLGVLTATSVAGKVRL